jgi:hypothetical protein
MFPFLAKYIEVHAFSNQNYTFIKIRTIINRCCMT